MIRIEPPSLLSQRDTGTQPPRHFHFSRGNSLYKGFTLPNQRSCSSSQLTSLRTPAIVEETKRLAENFLTIPEGQVSGNIRCRPMLPTILETEKQPVIAKSAYDSLLAILGKRNKWEKDVVFFLSTLGKESRWIRGAGKLAHGCTTFGGAPRNLSSSLLWYIIHMRSQRICCLFIYLVNAPFPQSHNPISGEFMK